MVLTNYISLNILFQTKCETKYDQVCRDVQDTQCTTVPETKCEKVRKYTTQMTVTDIFIFKGLWR